MMKNTLQLFVLLCCFGILFGCTSTKIKHLSGIDFINQAEKIKQMNSYSWTTYIGSSANRAYLEVGNPAFIGKGSRTTVFWTYLKELPEGVSQQLKEDKPPWISWRTKSSFNDDNPVSRKTLDSDGNLINEAVE